MTCAAEKVVAAVSSARVVIVPLCAAFAAALVAHIGIDVLGDYLLPHDTYDDVAHGSRTLVFGGVLAMLGGLLACGLSAAIREARGSLDAFSRALHRSVQLRTVPFLATTFAAALPVLASMEAFDAICGGRAVDDAGDIFGGSLELGIATLAASAIVCALLARAGVRAFAGTRRLLVSAFAAVFAPRRACDPLTSPMAHMRVRTVAISRFIGTVRSGRAPPLRAFVYASISTSP